MGNVQTLLIGFSTGLLWTFLRRVHSTFKPCSVSTLINKAWVNWPLLNRVSTSARNFTTAHFHPVFHSITVGAIGHQHCLKKLQLWHRSKPLLNFKHFPNRAAANRECPILHVPGSEFRICGVLLAPNCGVASLPPTVRYGHSTCLVAGRSHNLNRPMDLATACKFAGLFLLHDNLFTLRANRTQIWS